MADFGAVWLGWDVARGCPADQLDIAGLDGVTETPRKYGFHGTLKPPFRLAEGCRLADLQDAVADLASRLGPATCGPLGLTKLGRFLALVPAAPTDDLAKLAAACVIELDSFRAPASEEELARRRATNLDAVQDANLTQWGYPNVLDAFRFHLTLTGSLASEEIAHWQAVLSANLPSLAHPFIVTELALVGERADGQFEVIHRYSLTG